MCSLQVVALGVSLTVALIAAFVAVLAVRCGCENGKHGSNDKVACGFLFELVAPTGTPLPPSSSTDQAAEEALACPPRHVVHYVDHALPWLRHCQASAGASVRVGSCPRRSSAPPPKHPTPLAHTHARTGTLSLALKHTLTPWVEKLCACNVDAAPKVVCNGRRGPPFQCHCGFAPL